MKRQPGLIVGSATPPLRALMQATKRIPIVMFAVGDPEGQGFVASRARPGGNVTSLSSCDHGILAKQFEPLLQAAPQARRIGVALNPDVALHAKGLQEVDAAAARPGRAVAAGASARARRHRADEAVAAARAGRRGALLRQPGAQHRRPRGAARRLRAAAALADGDQRPARRLPHYVIRILEGTPPGELPVEQPTRFYTTINLKTARALELKLPQTLLLQADEVIE